MDVVRVYRKPDHDCRGLARELRFQSCAGRDARRAVADRDSHKLRTVLMNHRFHWSLSLVLLLAILAASVLPVHPHDSGRRAFKRDPSSAALKWANEELKKMSLEEKVGQ